jgi:hypothetical protein
LSGAAAAVNATAISTAADKAAQHGIVVVRDKATCNHAIESPDWLGTMATAEECGKACADDPQGHHWFLWVKYDDKNCQCVPENCELQDWISGVVYKFDGEGGGGSSSKGTCANTPDWKSLDGADCLWYELHPKSCAYGGAAFGYPEKNCCVCGKEGQQAPISEDGTGAPVAGCLDSPGWSTGDGWTCAWYAKHGCNYVGAIFKYPEANCCACGKSAAPEMHSPYVSHSLQEEEPPAAEGGSNDDDSDDGSGSSESAAEAEDGQTDGETSVKAKEALAEGTRLLSPHDPVKDAGHDKDGGARGAQAAARAGREANYRLAKEMDSPAKRYAKALKLQR